MKLRKQAEVLLNLGESPAAIVGRMKTFLGFDLTPKTASPEPAVNHASPDSVVNNASHEFAVNYDPAEPAVKHAPPHRSESRQVWNPHGLREDDFCEVAEAGGGLLCRLLALLSL